MSTSEVTPESVLGKQLLGAVNAVFGLILVMVTS